MSLPSLFFSPQVYPMESSFDLHGFRVQAAKAKVKELFEEARENNTSKLTIVTGIGNHSNNGMRAVLYHALPKWLETPELKSMIKEVRRDMGGYEVILNNTKRDELEATTQETIKVVEPMLFPPEMLESIKEKAKKGSAHHM